MNLQEIQKSTINLVLDFPAEYTSKIIKMALAALQPKPQDLSKPLDRLVTEKNISKDQIYEVLSTYIAILKLFVHSSDKDFINTLLEIGFPNEFVESLPFVNNRKELTETYFTPYYGYFQNVSSIKWRIDISLFNSSLVNKALPNVILCIKLKNGKSFTVELNPKAFHKVRFNVAFLLKEIKSLQSKPFLNKMCASLISIGEKNDGDAVRRILRQMMSHELSLQYNCTSKNKICSGSNKNIVTLIPICCRNNPLTRNVTESEVAALIKVWLHTAADRLGTELEEKTH